MSAYWKSVILLLLAAAIPAAGCKDDDGGYGLDDGLGTDDVAPSLCDSYPAADNAFSVGSVVRNYDLWDMEDEELRLCDLAKGNAKLIFLAITDES